MPASMGEISMFEVQRENINATISGEALVSVEEMGWSTFYGAMFDHVSINRI
jgi:hypothetical protein